MPKIRLKKVFFLSFPPFFLTKFTLMVDIIILNPIGSYKLNFNDTIFVLRPICLSQNSSNDYIKDSFYQKIFFYNILKIKKYLCKNTMVKQLKVS